MEASGNERGDDPATLASERGEPLIAALEQRLSDAPGRAEIAATLAAALGAALETGAAESRLIAEAARLQEVGKLYVPGELLGVAPEALGPAARERLETHFASGRDLARGAGVPERACTWILHARERWDGSGPGGLAGAEIPLGSRVIAVTREYLDAPLVPAAAELDPRAAALERLGALAGSVLDPEIASLATELAAASGD